MRFRIGGFRPAVAVLASAMVLGGLLAGCGPDASGQGNRLRLGYLANVTHAAALYGIASGLYQRQLGTTRLVPRVFNAGPAEVEALFAGGLDAAYLGPNPAINGFLRSHGQALRIVAGATSGGAELVVAPGITGAAQLKGRTLADPQLGGSQDIALRTYLAAQGFHEDPGGGGDVKILQSDNPLTLQAFRSGQIAGAWVPEPWASRLVLDGGGSVLVDERSQWPSGRFPTTELVVADGYLRSHAAAVQRLVSAQVQADRDLSAGPARTRQAVNEKLRALTGKALSAAVLARAFTEISLTEDPLAGALRTAAEHAFATGLVQRADLRGIVDLTILDRVLGHQVDDGGLSSPAATPTRSS